MVPFHPVKITRVSRNISYHLYHNFAQSQSISSIVLAADHDETNDSYPKPLPQHQRNSQEWAKLISTQVSNCTNLKQLNHYYAHIIRTQLLSFYDAPFYWNNVIRSYTRLNSPHRALRIYIAMARAAVVSDCYTLPIVLKAVSQVLNLGLVLQLHAVAIRIGLVASTFCESGFISLYWKVGLFECARKVFDENC